VGTGEGKSVLLGAVSCLLAILDYDVYCASYSPHLSKRDEDAFTPLFLTFRVKNKIHYRTLNGLVEMLINEKGDVRSLVENRIARQGQGGKAELPTRKKILLIDEVDVFFSESFYGKTYDIVNYYPCEETVEIMSHIWNNRGSVQVSHLKALPCYARLLSNFRDGIAPLIDQHLGMMIEDAQKFNDPPYIVKDGKRIGYIMGDSLVADELTFDYRTAFAYLHEVSHYPDMRQELPKVLALNIPCGRYSYAEVPISSTLNDEKPVFDCIMGVTGTIRLLSP
jgi:hypothetical protein